MPRQDARPIRPARATAMILATLLAAAGCGPAPGPSPSASPSPTATADPSPAGPLEVYAAIAAQVAAIRGLELTSAIAPVVIDAATLRTNLQAAFDRDNPPETIAANERLLRALGFLGPDISLRDAIIDLNASQVIGYYSSTDDTLFVVDRGGALGATARVTYAHEFTHQLQDQQFDLDSLGLAEIDESDRALALLAFVEGDATLTQTRWMTENLDPGDLTELLRDATDPAITAAIARAPRYLVATSLFPYQDGGAFVGTVSGGDVARVDDVYDRLPTTSEQILHPEKYLAGETGETPFDEPPPAWRAALGPGWSADPADTLGEFLIRLWLIEAGIGAAEAVAAAAGWNGDRIVLFAGPGDAVAVVLVTDWDTPSDAAAFTEAASRALTQLDLESRLIEGPGGRVVVVLGSDGVALEPLAELVAGR